MPLRKWFRDHHLPGWYSWVVVVGTSLASSTLVLLVALNSTERAIQAERVSQQASRMAACEVVVAQDDAFQDPDNPPVTPAGKRAAEAWHELRLAMRCDEK